MKRTGKKTKSTVADLLKTPSPVASPAVDSLANFMRESSSSKGTKRVHAARTSPPSGHRAPSNISDLRNLASSEVDDLKRRIDGSHSEILKDIEASHSRLHKRFKASYEEFMTEAQASESRACKTSMFELSQSFEKAIDSIRNRHGISSN